MQSVSIRYAISSPRPSDGGRRIVAPAVILGELFDLADQIEVPDKFMADLDDRPPQKQKLF